MMHFAVSFALLFAVTIGLQAQTFPHITLHGAVLPNHSYVPFGEVKDDETERGQKGVECHTDLATCCTKEGNIPGAGAWHFPNGTRISFDQLSDIHIYMRRQSQKVVLYQRQGGKANYSGIYQCAVPTNSSSPGVELVYVGVYNESDGKKYSTTGASESVCSTIAYPHYLMYCCSSFLVY